MQWPGDCTSSQSSSIHNTASTDYIKIGHNVVQQNKRNFISPLSILNLCANLSATTKSTRVQIIINTFLKQITNAPQVLIIPILANNEEGLIQVINEKVLDKELRFTLTTNNIKNASNQGFRFLVTDINREFKEIVETLIGIEYNIIYFDIEDLNKNRRSNLPAMASLNENCGDSLANDIKNCSIILNDDLTLSPINNDGKLKITFFVCIAGDESNRIYYRYCIYETLRFSIGHLLTAIELDEEIRIGSQCLKLLKISRRLLGNIRDFKDLIGGVINEAKEIIQAENVCLFLRSTHTNELVSIFIDPDEYIFDDILIQASGGIAGYVARTGKILNIRNAYSHPLFNKEIDQPIDQPINTQHIFCFPVYDRDTVIGAVQFYNKLNGYHFDTCDEQVGTAFSTYITLAIMEVLVLKSVQKAEARHKLAYELIIYHMKISEDDIKEIVHSIDDSKNKIENLNKFTFATRKLNVMETYKASMQMFADLNFINKFNIRRDKLARFIIVIAKSYRDLPYHNWMHAFSVGHFGYAILMNCKLVEKGILSELDSFAFLISTFCHDVDHRGTTNFFQKFSKTDMALLYACEGSINERHHLAQTMYILNDDNCKILDGLSAEEHAITTETIKELIIASDLAYLINTIKIKSLDNLNIDNCHENRHMLLVLLMTCCDFCDQVKKWPTSHKVADAIYAEFFAQGDLEKSRGLDPAIQMDRLRAIKPVLQIDFLEHIVMPSFVVLAKLFPETKSLLGYIKKTLTHWDALLPLS